MSTVLYLDQNVLSELRARKRVHNPMFQGIYNAIVSNKDIHVFYSYTNLDETMNIRVEEYKEEHIDTLCELEAIYIKPMDQGLDFRSPRLIWGEHLKNRAENEVDGGAEAELVFEKLGKKMSGISVNESAPELLGEMKSLALSSIMELEDALLQVTHEELALAGTSAKEVKAHIAELKERALDIDPTSLPIDESEGPRAFRAWLEGQGLDMNKVQPERIVESINELFIDINGKPIEQVEFYDGSILSNVARAYSLMNWAGYHPDDFTRTKKGKDRYRAAQYDMTHVAHAIACNYLVSNDPRMCKKAIACYSYMGSKAKVVSPAELLENCL